MYCAACAQDDHDACTSGCDCCRCSCGQPVRDSPDDRLCWDCYDRECGDADLENGPSPLDVALAAQAARYEDQYQRSTTARMVEVAKPDVDDYSGFAR